MFHKTYEPVAKPAVVKETRAYPAHQVFVETHAPDGSAPSDEHPARVDGAVVYAPGIDPVAVRSVEFDPICYFDGNSARQVRVTYVVYEADEHLQPETEAFRTLQEFRDFYAQ